MSEPAPKSWRDVLPIHPAAELWPLMEADELRKLGLDIKANGMRVPIVVVCYDGDDHPERYVRRFGIEKSIEKLDLQRVDGRNRLDAIELDDVRQEDNNCEFCFCDAATGALAGIDWCGYDGDDVVFLSTKYHDAYDYVTSVNDRRRHMTTAQCSEVADKLLRERTEWSDRKIAKEAQVDHTTVASKRRKLEATGEIHQTERRTGADGRTRKRPVQKPATPAPEDVG